MSNHPKNVQKPNEESVYATNNHGTYLEQAGSDGMDDMQPEALQDAPNDGQDADYKKKRQPEQYSHTTPFIMPSHP
jgi:hypothetical protein